MVVPITLDVLSVSFDTILKGIILRNPSLKEPEIVKEYINTIKHQYDGKPLITWIPRVHLGHMAQLEYYNLLIKAKFVHQKPYALFNSSNKPCDKPRVELGDILFVVKYYSNGHSYYCTPGELEQMRASFLQAKLSKNDKNWKISTHQQEFLLTPSKYPFHFGKRVDPNRKIRKIVSNSKWLFTYLLMSTSEQTPNLVSSPEMVELWRQEHCNKKEYDFPLDIFLPMVYSTNSRMPIYKGFKWHTRFMGGSYALWLYKFLKKSGIGGYAIKNCRDVNPELKDLVKTIYRFTGLQPDPPGEFDEYSEEGAFGIVEFTFAPPEGEVEHRRFE